MYLRTALSDAAALFSFPSGMAGSWLPPAPLASSWSCDGSVFELGSVSFVLLAVAFHALSNSCQTHQGGVTGGSAPQ